MRKSARLDQVLMSLGLVDEEQVRRALRRQRVEGGRFGTNLVALGSITESDLVQALAEQFNLTTVEPDERTLSEELVRRMPPAVLRGGRALPLAWNEAQKVLTLAVTDPGDEELVDEVKASFGARAVRLRLAPDSVMAAVGQRLAARQERPGDHSSPGTTSPPDAPRGAAISLPELFGDGDERAPAPDAAPERTAILVARRGSLSNFLPPLFAREGYSLITVSDEHEAAGAFARDDVEAVLVTPGMHDALGEWVRRDVVRLPRGEVIGLTSVAESLVANPVPYAMTAGSLKRTVEALADARSSRFEAAIPYGLVASDAAELGRRVGLPRLAVDALHMAAHLLLPAPFEKTSGSVCWEQPFEEFRSSLELARRIRFPWRLDALLLATHALFSRRTTGADDGPDLPREPATPDDETLLAARVLAVCWYRHIFILRTSEETEEAFIALRADLRREMSPLSTSEVVEAYLELIRQRGGPRTDRDDAKILLVGSERLEDILAPALRRVGRRTFATRTLAEAQVIMERSTPAALIVDGSEFPRDVAKFSRVTKLDGSALIFVVTDASDPSMAMSLLEVGIDDVFAPPHEFDLMAAKISRAIQSRARVASREESPPGQFSSDFEVFSFLDLVQMLSQGLKTVRIDLTRTADERAVLFMERGRIVHAVSGSLLGAEAVYEVIRWEDDGEFTVRQEDSARFPDATIELATDSLLMEGVRLLDESRR